MLDSLSLVAATDDGLMGSLLFNLVFLALAVLIIASMWKVFTKAGRPGWAAIIPIYNAYTLIKVAGRPGWWVLLTLIPVVNFIISIIVAIDVAKAFGKDAAFGILGLWLFSFVGYPMLAFGDATYNGPAAVAAADPAPSEPAAAPAETPAPAEEAPSQDDSTPTDTTPPAPKPPVVQ